ncbi:hypothetical protein ACHWQZ_G019592 [Mnemiopsis leidyi]
MRCRSFAEFFFMNRVSGMQDDAAKLLEIFKELNKLQGYQKQIRLVQCRLQKIMDTENKLPGGPEFEAKLASNIHPFMYSYPEPLGDRYRDVQSLLDELADKSSTRAVQHQRYLETVLQFKDKGYRYAVCNGSKFSPANSGINIDPETYPFRSSASDNCLYFTGTSDKSSTTETTKNSTSREFFSTKEGIETAGETLGLTESMICNPPSEKLGSTKSTDSSCKSSTKSKQQLSERMSTLPESLICNQPESVYQSLISSSDNCSTKSSPSSSSSLSSSSSKENRKPVSSPTYDEIEQYREFYTQPVSALDPSTYSKYKTVRSMVVSQTWLTGWIKELYDIEGNIVTATGKPLS